MSADGTRIDRRFEALSANGRSALVTFITAGDPDYETSLSILKGLPGAGADLIEIGMPFSDPMAEGPPIQLSSQRALAGGQTMERTFEMVRDFRSNDDTTPIVLMGYYNPIYHRGPERFLRDARNAGVDGLIIVDLPPEADEELCLPAREHDISFIRLATPTSDERRLRTILANTSGFVYYVSITGITGVATPDFDEVAAAVGRIKGHTALPVVVGFGIKTPDHAAIVASKSDGAVVGSALVNLVRDSLDPDGRATEKTASSVLSRVTELAKGVRSARKGAA